MLPGSRFQFPGPGAGPGYLHFNKLPQEGVLSPSLCLQAVRRKGKPALREREMGGRRGLRVPWEMASSLQAGPGG